MLDFILKLNQSFSESDKEECKPVIYKIVDLANLARTQGILALEHKMEQEQSLFLRTGINLVIKGKEELLIKEILQSMIIADGYSGSQLLSRLLMTEGVLSIQRCDQPEYVALKLSALLGEKYVERINDEMTNNQNMTKNYYYFLNSIKDKKALPESADFEFEILNLSNLSIQLVLRGIDISCLLAALHGSSFQLIIKIFENIPMNLSIKISENWELTKALQKESIFKSQQEILDIIYNLRRTGEIKPYYKN